VSSKKRTSFLGATLICPSVCKLVSAPELLDNFFNATVYARAVCCQTIPIFSFLEATNSVLYITQFLKFDTKLCYLVALRLTDSLCSPICLWLLMDFSV
jgi:hypothetical protein